MGAESWGLQGHVGGDSLAGSQAGRGVWDPGWVLGRSWARWGPSVFMSGRVKRWGPEAVLICVRMCSSREYVCSRTQG